MKSNSLIDLFPNMYENKYRVVVYINKQKIDMGRFKTLEAAINALEQAKVRQKCLQK